MNDHRESLCAGPYAQGLLHQEYTFIKGEVHMLKQADMDKHVRNVKQTLYYIQAA